MLKKRLGYTKNKNEKKQAQPVAPVKLTPSSDDNMMVARISCKYKKIIQKKKPTQVISLKKTFS